MELFGNTPYIDFHFNNESSDYTSRIIEDAKGVLSSQNVFNFKKGIRFDGINTFKVLWDAVSSVPTIKVDNTEVPLVVTNGINKIRVNWNASNGGRLEVYVDGTYVGYLPLSH